MTLDPDRWYQVHRRALRIADAGGLTYPEAMDLARARHAIEEAREACGDGEPSPGLRADVIPIPQEAAACAAIAIAI